MIILLVQDGENTHDHKILHTTENGDIQAAAREYASTFYGDNSEFNEHTKFWEFNAGCIAVQLYNVVELTEFEYNLIKRIFDGDPRPNNYFDIVAAGKDRELDREEIQIHAGEHGNIMIHQDGDKLGFIVDVYGENDIANTMTVWEDELED